MKCIVGQHDKKQFYYNNTERYHHHFSPQGCTIPMHYRPPIDQPHRAIHVNKDLSVEFTERINRSIPHHLDSALL